MNIKRVFRAAGNIANLIILGMILVGIMIMYENYSAQLPLKIIFFVILIEYVLFQIFGRLLKISIVFANSYESKEVPVKLQININKKSIYPFKNIKIMLSYKSAYAQNEQNKALKLELRDGINQREVSDIKGLPCGYTCFEIKEAMLFDMFGVGSIRLKGRKTPTTLLVMPVPKPVTVDIPKIPYIHGDDSEIFLEDKGKDSSELYEIREFRDGDALNRIHWKLSSKSDELMVRDSVTPIETNIYVFFDLNKNSNLDDMFENAVSIAYELRSMGYAFYICWYENSTGRMRRILVSEYEHIETAVAELMNSDLYELDDAVEDVLKKFMNGNHQIYNLFILS